MKLNALIILSSLLLAPFVACADEAQDKALVSATKQGNIQEIRHLLDAGAHVDSVEDFSVNQEGLQSIHYAVKSGNIKLVKILLDAGAKIDAIDFAGMQPIHYAAIDGNVEMIKFLLAAGADANASDRNGQKPLQIALYKGNNEAVKILSAAEANPKPISHSQPTKTTTISTELGLPRKIADYFINPIGNWGKGNPFEGEIVVSKISPNIYKVDYYFQQPIEMDSSAAMIPTLNECLANYIADKTHSPGWDLGQERDMYDRNYGNPFSNLTYLILTGAKDGESRERATGRKTMAWKYGEILDNKTLRYQNGYVIGDCKKLLKPEFTKHTPDDIAIEPIQETKGGFHGGMFNLVKPELMSGENPSPYEGRISVKPIAPNFYSVKYSYVELQDTSTEGGGMYYSLSQGLMTMCVGGYLANKQGYDVWDIGMGKFLNKTSNKDGLNSFEYFVLVNPKEGISRVEATGVKDIHWFGEQSSIANLRSVNKMNKDMCRKLLKPEYVPS